MEQQNSSIPPIEISALYRITPQEADTLVKFMREFIPASKDLNPALTWEEGFNVDKLFDKVRSVLTCLSYKEAGE